MRAQLGKFALEFEPGGKLRQLWAERRPLLYETSRAVDMGSVSFVPGGWDECFPTIDPSPGSPTMGLLIAHAPRTCADEGEVVQTWEVPGLRAERRFSAGAQMRLDAKFSARNCGAEALPFLWASHALFSFDGLVSVELPGQAPLKEFSLDETAPKFFVTGGAPVVLRWTGLRCALLSDQPHWGVWLNRGGWPAGLPGEFGCIGIEATTTPAEVPQDRRLMPGEVFEGRVTLQVLT